MKNNTTVTVRIRFFTNPPDGELIPKQISNGGMVELEANEAHDLHPRKSYPFHSLAAIAPTIEKLLGDNGVTVKLGKSTR